MKTVTLLIGTDGVHAADSATTLKQIQAVEALECALEHENEKISWEGFDNPDEPRSLFQSILRDRKRRIDEHTMMADRPSFAVVTATGGKVIRLEYYEGHDALRLEFDLRSKELQGKTLPNFIDEDPQAYNPAKFLEEFFGIPESVSKPILDETHREEADHA